MRIEIGYLEQAILEPLSISGPRIKAQPHLLINLAANTNHWNMSLRSLPNWFLAFKGASPNVRWMNLSIETSSI